MKFSIASKTFDPSGIFDFNLEGPGEGLQDRVRRTGGSQTLDGGVVVEDGGFSHGDRLLTVKAKVTKTGRATLQRIVELYPTVNVSFEDGFFTAVLTNLSFTGNVATVRVQLVSKDN